MTHSTIKSVNHLEYHVSRFFIRRILINLFRNLWCNFYLLDSLESSSIIDTTTFTTYLASIPCQCSCSKWGGRLGRGEILLLLWESWYKQKWRRWLEDVEEEYYQNWKETTKQGLYNKSNLINQLKFWINKWFNIVSE